MAYTAWSVVYGEQPTAAKWNQLGTNDAGFKDGTNIDNSAIIARHLATNAVTGDKLGTSAILLGLLTLTANFTTTSTSPVLVTGASIPVTVPAGGRSVKITVYARANTNTVSGNYAQIGIWDGSVGGTRIGGSSSKMDSASSDATAICMAIHTPAAGARTYNISLNAAGGGTAALSAISTEPMYVIVELI